MTSGIANLTTSDLVALITKAAKELESRASQPTDAQPLNDAPTGSSPVFPRRCNYCKGPILLVATEKSGQWIPLDEQEGHFILVNGWARWVDGGGSHAFHYDNCPGSIQNQPQKPKTTLFDELAEELGHRAASNDMASARGEA
jgi:hypothetical protein